MKREGKLHYGWAICLGCTLLMFCCSGLVISAFSVYLPYLVDEFQLSQTEASMISTFRSLFSLASKFAVMWVIDRLDVRKTMGLGALCITVSFFLYGFAGNLLFIYLAACIAGVGYGFATMVPVSILLNRWFREKLALATAMCVASTGIAPMIFPRLITTLIETHSLTLAFAAEGSMVLLICTLAIILIRNDPRDKNTVPFITASAESASHKETKSVEGWFPLTKRQQTFFLLAPFFLGAVALTAPGLFMLHFIGQGFDSMTAASAISISGIAMLLGKFAYGFSSDYLGQSKTNYLFLTLFCLSMLMGCFISESLLCLYIFSIGFGISVSVSSVGVTMWAKEFSAPGEYDRTIRKYQIVHMLGTLMISPAAGMIADHTGSYVPVFGLFAALMLCTVLILLYSYKVGVINRDKEQSKIITG